MVLDPFCGCATACIAAEKLGRQWVGIDISPKAADLVKLRLHNEIGLFWQGTHRTDIPMRTDLGVLPSYRTHKHTLFGKQEGLCAGCQVMFPFRNMTVDHIVPQSKGGTDHRDNLQLLCNACNSMKAAGTQEAFIAKLKASTRHQESRVGQDLKLGNSDYQLLFVTAFTLWMSFELWNPSEYSPLSPDDMGEYPHLAGLALGMVVGGTVR